MLRRFLTAIAVLALAGSAVAGTRNVGPGATPAQTYQEVVVVDPATGALNPAQSVSGSVSVTNFPGTQPVSGADGAVVTLGAKADAAAGTGSASMIALMKQLHLDLLAATPAGTANIGSTTGNVGYVESTTAPPASGNVVGVARPTPVWATTFGCRTYGSAPGTLYVLEPYSGATGTAGAVAAVGNASGFAADISVPVRGGSSYFCYFVSGATAQTTFVLLSSFRASN